MIATFRHKGAGGTVRALLSVSFVLPVVGAVLFAYLALSGRSEPVKMAGLVFASGLYTLAAVEDMLGGAHEAIEDTRWSAVSFLALSGGSSSVSRVDAQPENPGSNWLRIVFRSVSE